MLTREQYLFLIKFLRLIKIKAKHNEYVLKSYDLENLVAHFVNANFGLGAISLKEKLLSDKTKCIASNIENNVGSQIKSMADYLDNEENKYILEIFLKETGLNSYIIFDSTYDGFLITIQGLFAVQEYKRETWFRTFVPIILTTCSVLISIVAIVVSVSV